MRTWRSVLTVLLVAGLLAGCSGRFVRTRGQGGLGRALATVYICPRVGYTLNEGRRIRGFEYLYAVPVVFSIPMMTYAFDAFQGNTTLNLAFEHELDPLPSRPETLEWLRLANKANLLSEKDYKDRLKLLAKGSYTNLVVAKAAKEREAVTPEEYNSILVRLLGERDHMYNPLNKDLLDAAEKARVLDDNGVKEQIRKFLEYPVPSLHALQMAKSKNVIAPDEYRRRLEALYKQVYRP